MLKAQERTFIPLVNMQMMVFQVFAKKIKNPAFFQFKTLKIHKAI